ncbi:MAG: DUF1345 domain-containing protein [Alphaproteobacteria bacterium]|jgi:uncharacterized membrane protein|nr:DUF1345 domain-containing protein [Alphaproteobacteria bacterium]MBN9558174.1 DUF1345 domain-containing protein [Alphaproteobacteria bacterium]MBN9566211.1 DUF1345 domain-containing protein [Alphaproteobacteria bacterium]MBN9572263.1 DUF1345 domain-containing protein [Alphaproteobacteria bacterium]MBN9577418.1 DUF1345 domain-containing protein [Alphaproteobacteria bacterium]
MSNRSSRPVSIARAHWSHHWRFYAAIAVGLVVFAAYSPAISSVRVAAAGDAFFVTYLAASALLLWSTDTQSLKQRADIEDEGGFIVVLIALIVIGFCSAGIFSLLNQKQLPDAFDFALSIASAPLGWLTLHTIAAFHYANLYYFSPGGRGGRWVAPLEFPGKAEPGGVDFLYYSFVVGMTAQVSDVQVCTARMRAVTLAHGVVSFFFNTVLIAIAVNAVVASAS